MRRNISFVCAMGIVAGGSRLAVAQGVPPTISLTARLMDESGAPASGPHAFAFRLFDTPTGGSAAWSEGQVTVALQAGLLYRELGTLTTLDATVFDGTPKYLEIEVDAVVMSPRLAIVSVPYAMRAGVAATAESLGGLSPGDVITGVTAGDGLSAIRTGTTVSLSADFAGPGVATTVARSDHTHAGTYLPVGTTLSCAVGQKVTGLEVDGDVSCGTDADTTYIASPGGGLTLSAGAFAVDFGGSGVATTVARSDHDHAGVYVPVGGEADGVVGNEVADVADTTLALTGAGTTLSPRRVGLNLANSNTWTASQTIAAPYPQLTLRNTAGAAYLHLDKPDDTFESGLAFHTGGVASFYLWTDNDTTGDLRIIATGLPGEGDATPRLSVPRANKNLLLALSGGNVGVGTATPAVTLDVAGEIAGTPAVVVAGPSAHNTTSGTEYSGPIPTDLTLLNTSANTFTVGAAGITVNRAGFYEIEARLLALCPDNSWTHVRILRNGTHAGWVGHGNFTDGGSWRDRRGSRIMNLNAGDVITFEMYNNLVCVYRWHSLNGNSDYTSLQIVRLN